MAEPYLTQTKLKKFIALYSLILICISISFASLAFAQGTTKTLIPEVNKNRFRSNYDCTNLMKAFEDTYYFALDDNSNSEIGTLSRFYDTIDYMNAGKGNTEQFAATGPDDPNAITSNDILGCSIITGRINLSYLTMFISYVIRMATILAGTISILFIMIGGYKYVIAGVTESQDGAKNTIRNAIIGLAVSTGAWIIVNIYLALQTT